MTDPVSQAEREAAYSAAGKQLRFGDDLTPVGLRMIDAALKAAALVRGEEERKHREWDDAAGDRALEASRRIAEKKAAPRRSGDAQVASLVET